MASGNVHSADNMMKTEPKKNQLLLCKKAFVFALPCEAFPFIKALNAQHTFSEYGFKLYVAADTAIVIVGAGRTAMAAGLVWAKTHAPGLILWVNVGIAGLKNGEIGALKIASSVREGSTKKVFYPHLLFKAIKGEKLAFSELLTVDSVQANYPAEQMLDMEASSFIETARRFAKSEAIQVIKVVSDNEEHNITHINAAFVEQLINDNISTVLAFMTKAGEKVLPHALNESIERRVDNLEARMRLSVSQRLHLIRQLSTIQHANEHFDTEPYHHAKSLLKALDQHILQTPLSLT